MSLDSKGRLIDKYNVIKVLASKFCIKVNKTRKNKWHKNVRIREHYIVLEPDRILYDVIHNIVVFRNSIYDNEFMEKIIPFNRFEAYVKKYTIDNFVENESLAHLLAKEKIIEWMNDGNLIDFDVKINNTVKKISFKKNHSFIEYPVVTDGFNSLNKLWNNQYTDTVNKKMEFAEESTIDSKSLCTPSPKYRWCCKKKLYPIYILDAAISENGHIKYGIEIVNTHEISEKKRCNIQRTLQGSECVAVIEVSAQWILNQKEKPKIIELTKYISSDEYIVSSNFADSLKKWNKSDR